VHHERGCHGQEHREQQSIEKRLVIGDDERALVLENRRITADTDPKQEAQQPAQTGPHHTRSGGRLTRLSTGALQSDRWFDLGIAVLA
jgi:hypothetical protein